MKKIVSLNGLMMTMLLMATAAGQEAREFIATTTDGNPLYYTITNSAEGEVSVRALPSNRYEGALEIPDSVRFEDRLYAVTAIEERGFEGQGRMTSVVLPSSLKTVGEKAFAACDELDMMMSRAAEPPSVQATAFEECDMKQMLLEVPCQSGERYAASCVWGKCGEIGEDCNAALERALSDDVVIKLSRSYGLSIHSSKVHDIRVYDNYGRLAHISRSNVAYVSVRGRCMIQIDDRPPMEMLVPVRKW